MIFFGRNWFFLSPLNAWLCDGARSLTRLEEQVVASINDPERHVRAEKLDPFMLLFQWLNVSSIWWRWVGIWSACALPPDAAFRRLVRVPNTQLHCCVVDVVSRHRGMSFRRSIGWSMEAKYQGTGRGRCWPLCDYIARVSDMGLRGNFDEVRGEF